MKDTMFQSEERMNRKDTAEYLRALADRIEENQVVLKDSARESAVDLPEELDVEVEYTAKQKKGGTRYKLELELKWGPSKGGLGLA